MTVTVQQYVSPEKNEGAERSSLRRPIYLSFLLLIIAMPLVILLLQGSGYAGNMDDTQLGFNAVIIKVYFSMMTPEGILLFQLGNLADYLFMLSYGTAFYNGSRYLSWNYPEGSIQKKIGITFAWMGVSSAICDGIENIFLFVMTFDPLGFPSWLAIAHSTFASLKFLMMYTTFAWILLSMFLNKTVFRSYSMNR